MRPIVADVLYEAGEIVAQGVQTFDVYAKRSTHVTISGRPVTDWEGRLKAMTITDNDLVCMRLRLVAGDRLKVRKD